MCVYKTVEERMEGNWNDNTHELAVETAVNMDRPTGLNNQSFFSDTNIVIELKIYGGTAPFCCLDRQAAVGKRRALNQR